MSETASMSSEMNPVALSSDSDSDTRSAEHGQLRNDVVNSISQQSLDSDTNPDEEEEKQRFISQVLDLQNTLDDLSQRVDSVKEENLKLKSENQVLGQYIENLMSASSVFQSTSPKGGKK
ncbi:Short coiled-coil protein B [Lamellibrachia satsuma]|nr:Short coiled-coil protein B [Lamellibrachia satsuma]